MVILLYNAKDAASFYSSRWNTGTNPDLAFASVVPNNRLPDRRILKKFLKSQHLPSLITSPRFALAVPSTPVSRLCLVSRNFRKAKWSHYIALANKIAKTLFPSDSLDVDTAYQDFCNIIKKAAEKTIPRGYNYISYWDAGCEFSIECSCSLLRETTQVWLLQLCLPSLIGSGEIDGPRQFGLLSFHTQVEKHGVF